MRAVVAVTDNAWASFLRNRQPDLVEANFWLPSPTSGFVSRQPGEPFLFKTHHPENRLVGGGFVSGFTRLKVSEAWDFFGEGNGVASENELVSAINKYRRGAPEPDPLIGCILLRDLFFQTDGPVIPGPPDFARNIVRWKAYELTGDSYVEQAMARLLASSAGDSPSVQGPIFGDPRMTVPRLGQQAFKSMVLAAYHRRCAITGGRITPVLQAAHIRPVAHHGEHRLDNGLLLRSDVHTLFDQGYLGIDDHHRIHVSRRLREDFGNGAEFYARAGAVIELPERRAERPAREAVTWHMDTVFLN